ncbi:rhomboid family intramembrane serine protease [bacterium]|nr:rhomboid family intramembrane serine protease [bacterium]
MIPTKKCPVCNLTVLEQTEKCPRCNYKFSPEKEQTSEPEKEIFEQKQNPFSSAVRSKNTPITKFFLAVIILIWILMTLEGGSTSTETLLKFGAKHNPLITEGEFWRFLTATFLHIGFLHLLVNSYSLFILGKEIETFYGSICFTIIYIVSGLLGSILSYAFNTSISAGASGSIFGLIGASIVFFGKNKNSFGSIGKSGLNNALFIAGFNLLFGFSVSGIDNFGHVGGLLGGLFTSFLLVPTYQVIYDSDGNLLAFSPNKINHKKTLLALLISVFVLVTLIFFSVSFRLTIDN